MLKQKKFSLSQDVIDQIKIAAKADRRSQSSLVEKILRRELQKVTVEDDLKRITDAARRIS
jgi:hypothetical protein|tara:strand:+ start:179 stop:361 length:183 start_codon:yes stop_codon:yes gene_type:complete